MFGLLTVKQTCTAWPTGTDSVLPGRQQQLQLPCLDLVHLLTLETAKHAFDKFRMKYWLERPHC